MAERARIVLPRGSSLTPATVRPITIRFENIDKRYGGLYAFAPPIQVSEMLTPALEERCYAHFQNMAPIYQWLMHLGQ